MDWNELNGIQNVKQINLYECWTNSVSFRILVNAFDWIQIVSFQSNPLLNTNKFYLIPFTGIINETKPMRFNAVRVTEIECVSMLSVGFRISDWKKAKTIQCCQATLKLNASWCVSRNWNWKTVIAIECFQAIWKVNASKSLLWN